MKGYLTDVPGIKVGHSEKVSTGVTVVLPPKGSTCGVDVRGGAPGTRETDLLRPENFVDKVHGLILAGGSAYGLNAATGVMEYLEEKGIGLDVDVGIVPIVPGAVIFDLICGDPKIRPDHQLGYLACENASTEENRRGLVGAGIGATIGKILGPEYAMKSGIGSASVQVGDLVVGAITVLNAFGDIYKNGTQIAGVYDRENKKLLNTMEIYPHHSDYNAFSSGKNTTITIVATNGKFDKAGCQKISSMAHNGYGRAIYPVHTMFDGDTIFTVSTNEVRGDLSYVGALASKVVEDAIIDAVYAAKSFCGFPAMEDVL
ncbi:MAG: P1 family peptidase [Tissierellia bacterium]|nr:P1 family peptidase [Tissierellia bacterium]